MAWREFKRGKIKKSDVQEFEFNLEDNLFKIHEELTTKTYKHSNYTSFYITDPKLRHIHKACVRDRVLHHAVFRILYPIFDKSFIFDSFSCRIGKGTHRGVNRLKEFCDRLSRNNSKNIFALKCDVRKFFNSVDQEVLIEILGRKIKERDSLWLLEKIIKSYDTVNNKGLPIGNVTSQIFANIYLNELDQFIKRELKIKFYLRYCDDFVILDYNQQYLTRLSEIINSHLERTLSLKLHSNKIIIRTYRQGIDFLGYVIRPYCRTLRTKTKNRIFKKISSRNFSSYLGVLKHCDGYKIEQRLFDVKWRNW